MTELAAETLLTLGFRDIGRWVLARRAGCLDYGLDGACAQADKLLLEARNSLYAFVLADDVKYIGKTARTIRERFVGYKTPTQRQRTNWRNNRNIHEALAGGAAIRILVFNPISFLRYGDFEINLAAGLEDALIEAFDPPWNGRDRGRAITEEAEREEVDEVQVSNAPIAGAAPAPPAPSSGPPPPGVASFTIDLKETYYTQGLINPGVEASAHLGGDGDPIEVVFDDGTEPVLSRIDRRANPSGSVRIVGRNRAIARWFQAHFQKSDIVRARVLDAHRILLLSKSTAV
jgi:hypothetical protein